METVTYEVAVAALAQLTDQPYPKEGYTVTTSPTTLTHSFYGFGGREVHITVDHVGIPADTARVAFFRRFECREYECKGAALQWVAALGRFDELLKVWADY